MVPLRHTLLERDDVALLRRLSRELSVDLFLVGGGVRDLLLGRLSVDLDFALGGDADRLPRLFAEATGGRFFPLDRARGYTRVVLRHRGILRTYDFAPLRGKDIVADLSRRDFTVNAFAFSLATPDPPLIDPLSGSADLKGRLIRQAYPDAFTDDPLRLLRAFRFAATLGFAVAEETLAAVSRHASLLAGVAAERKRDEFFRLLAVPGAARWLALLAERGLLAVLVPSLAGIGKEDLAGRLARVERTEDAGRGRWFLSKECEGGVTAGALLACAALMGEASRGEVDEVACTVRLGTRCRRLLMRWTRPLSGIFPPGLSRSPRPFFRFFRDEGAGALPLVVLGVGAGCLTADRAERLYAYFTEEYDAAAPDHLLAGGEVAALLGTAEGPRVGEALARLREAERRGEVSTRAEAEAFVVKRG